MVVIRGLDRYRAGSRPSAVAIGNFDGVHLGHRKILARLSARARSKGFRPLVLTFFPHPERVLGKTQTLMIQSLDQRLEKLEEQGIDTVVVTPFDKKFSALTAEAFITEILSDRLRAADIFVGQNFRFGKGREGDTALLRALGRRHGLGVRVVAPAVVSGRVVSSTGVRLLLGRGRIKEAARLLGRPYEIKGRVVPGRSRGKALGFPTANLRTENEILPEGVFLTLTSWGRSFRPSLTSIGTNPTFRDKVLSVETYVLDFKKSLYGRTLSVRFLEKIRPTRVFPDADHLASRMAADLERARAYFRKRNGLREGRGHG